MEPVDLLHFFAGQTTYHEFNRTSHDVTKIAFYGILVPIIICWYTKENPSRRRPAENKHRSR